VRTLKEVGDTSLYVAGFFAKSLTRSLVDVDYYVGLGQSAYAQLARSLGTGSRSARSTRSSPRSSRGRRPLAMVRKRVTLAELHATSDLGRLYDILACRPATSGSRTSSSSWG